MRHLIDRNTSTFGNSEFATSPHQINPSLNVTPMNDTTNEYQFGNHNQNQRVNSNMYQSKIRKPKAFLSGNVLLCHYMNLLHSI